MTRNLATFGTLALLALAPVAFAQEETKEETNSTQARGDDAAWVENCPPDMMCAAQEPTRGPADGSCENCRGDETPVPYGPDGCVECSGPVDNGSCMDGADEGETCDSDVQYFDGGARPPDAESHGDVPDEAKPAPGLAALGVLGAFAAAVAVIGLRK